MSLLSVAAAFDDRARGSAAEVQAFAESPLAEGEYDSRHANYFSGGPGGNGTSASTLVMSNGLVSTDIISVPWGVPLRWEVLPAFDVFGTGENYRLEVEEIDHVLSDVRSGKDKRRDFMVREMDENRGKKLKRMSCLESAELEIRAAELPEELVEKIVALMPYPCILNARMLSKEWESKLTATSSENAGFRAMVKSVSGKWPSYFPLIFDKSKGFLAGFDHINHCWVRIFLGPSHVERQRIGVDTDQAPWERTEAVSGAGPLMCGMTHDMQIFVRNGFTGAWKLLPERARMSGSVFSWMHMFLDGPDSYIVLLMTPWSVPDGACVVCTQLYESRSNSWSMKLSTVNSFPIHDGNGVYLNGVVYFTHYDIGNGVLEVWAYNILQGTWHPIPHSFLLMMHTFKTSKLIVCQKRLILVVRLKRARYDDGGLERPRIRRNSLILYLLDAYTEKFVEVYRGPRETIRGASAGLYVSEGDSIYFGKLRKKSRFLMQFNMIHGTWTSYPSAYSAVGNLLYASFAFQPGRNPFMVV